MRGSRERMLKSHLYVLNLSLFNEKLTVFFFFLRKLSDKSNVSLVCGKLKEKTAEDANVCNICLIYIYQAICRFSLSRVKIDNSRKSCYNLRFSF